MNLLNRKNLILRINRDLKKLEEHSTLKRKKFKDSLYGVNLSLIRLKAYYRKLMIFYREKVLVPKLYRKPKKLLRETNIKPLIKRLERDLKAFNKLKEFKKINNLDNSLNLYTQQILLALKKIKIILILSKQKEDFNYDTYRRISRDFNRLFETVNHKPHLKRTLEHLNGQLKKFPTLMPIILKESPKRSTKTNTVKPVQTHADLNRLVNRLQKDLFKLDKFIKKNYKNLSVESDLALILENLNKLLVLDEIVLNKK